MKIHALAVAAMLLASCSNATQTSRSASASPASFHPRVISLAPSLTEIAFAVDCGNKLVADTAYDDYPSQAKALPHVADLGHADLERIARLAPTLIVALHDQEHEGAPIHARLGVPVVYLPNRNLSDLYADIEGVALACGTQPQGAALATKIRRQIAEIRERPHRATPTRVLYLLGLPGFSAGSSSYINDLIVLAGGQNVAGSIAQPYPNLSAEAILKADPDLIIVSNDTPFGADVRSREPWRSLRAVQQGHVVRPPDDSIVERNGPRVIEGLDWLSAQLR
ncbi:MAG: ABC transporter substrate-binding protein [Candidatus Eremiobacteraeota bacterium]|nr:ABC transporter substrate-binding protein [Candidatus Eremiobacteraeota bacterium]